MITKINHNWEVIPGGLTWLFVGQPKTGKTTQAAKWSEKGLDGVLILDTDHGADFINGANVIPISGLNAEYEDVLDKDGNYTYEKGERVKKFVEPVDRGYYYRTGPNKGKPMAAYGLSEVYAYLSENWDTLGYDTIVLDTVDEINAWAELDVLEELRLKAMGEGQWGADWGRARQKNVKLIKTFQEFLKKKGANLILIAHAKPTVITDGKTQLAPELPRGLARVLTAKADVIGYITSDKSDGKYYISFVSYDERMIGSRLKPLAQKKLLFDYHVVKNEITSYKEKQ